MKKDNTFQVTNRSHNTSDAQSITNVIGTVLPKGILVCCDRIDLCNGELYKDECIFVRNAINKRRREFLAGHTIARKLLEKLYHFPCSIPVGSMRQPVWPESVIGSITHDGDYCVVVAGHSDRTQLIGIDLAESTPLDPSLIPMICTKDEVKTLQHARNLIDFAGDPYKLVFSVKESIYKCLFPNSSRSF